MARSGIRRAVPPNKPYQCRFRTSLKREMEAAERLSSITRTSEPCRFGPLSLGIRMDAGRLTSGSGSTIIKEAQFFSLAPPHSLTIIDYQTFIQNGPIEACIFENPCDDIQPCSGNQIMTVRSRSKFSPPTA